MPEVHQENPLKERLHYLWRTWQTAAKRIGDFQAWLILSLCYVVLVWPLGLLVRLFSDPLGLKKPRSHWLSKPSSPAQIDEARRQF